MATTAKPTEPAPPEQPTRKAWDVRSAQTGAVVIRDISPKDAEREAARLNAEARRPVGRTLAGEVFAGMQDGEPTRYEVVTYETVDELVELDQIAAGLEAVAKNARKDGDKQLEQAARAELDQLQPKDKD